MPECWQAIERAIMVDLTALRVTTYRKTDRPWGRDFSRTWDVRPEVTGGLGRDSCAWYGHMRTLRAQQIHHCADATRIAATTYLNSLANES